MMSKLHRPSTDKNIRAPPAHSRNRHLINGRDEVSAIEGEATLETVRELEQRLTKTTMRFFYT